MTNVQKQSILILLQTIEQQIVAMKTLLSMRTDAEESATVTQKDTPVMGYTSDKEDDEITKAMEIQEDQRDVFMQDLFNKAQQKVIDDGGESI